jgi:hypothetical protein
MKKSFFATTAGVLIGATMLMGAAPAMAHDRIGFGVSIGVPIAAPVAYVAPAPVYAPAPVVYGGYGPVVRVGGPYYRDWHYYHGYHGYYGYRGGYHGWHR